MEIRDINKLVYILEISKKTLIFLVLISVLNSTIEVVGIGLIGNYLSLIITEKPIFENLIFNNFNFSNKFFSYQNLTILLIVIFIIKTFIQFYINLIILRFIGRKQFLIRNKLISIFQTKNFLEFIKFNKADITEIIYTLAGIVGHTSINSFLNLLSNFFLFFFIIIFLAFLNINILIISMISFIFIYLLFQKFFKIKLNLYGKLASNASANIYQSINNFYDSFAEIRFLNKKNYFKNILKISGYKYYKYHYLSQIISGIPKYLIELVFILIAIIFLLILKLKEISLISIIPEASIFIFSFLKLMPAFVNIIKNISDLNFSRFAINRIFTIYKKNKKKIYLNNSEKNLKKREFKSFRIFIKSFNYSKDSRILLKNTKIKIEKNKCIGIIGPSGSGKSTLLNLITGLVHNKKTTIHINDIMINQNNKSIWQNRIAYIKQDTFFFNDTLQENITLDRFKKKFDKQKFNFSLKNAYLDNLLNKDINFKKILGDGAQFISGGQRQRVAIARALYHDKEVLIFDEPTSALDYIAKNKIISQLKKLKKIKTMIIVTHDEKIKDICNSIYEINNYKIKKIK